jgi:hypothetical protein
LLTKKGCKIFGVYIIGTLSLHLKYIIMPRISATFNTHVERIANRYAIFKDISFSEAVEMLTMSSGIEWWNSISKKEKKEIDEKLEEKLKTKQP